MPVPIGRNAQTALPFRQALRYAGASGERPPEGAAEAVRLAWAAREFEAYFLQELWRGMRRSIPESGLFPRAAGSAVFEEMLDAERSRLMASTGQIGLAALIYERTLPYVRGTTERNGPAEGAAAETMPHGSATAVPTSPRTRAVEGRQDEGRHGQG